MSPERRAILLARFERTTEIPLLLLSVVFLVIFFAIESRTTNAEITRILDGLLWLIWGVFGVELAIKLYLAPERSRYLRSHWIEILIIGLPFLRPLRLLWLPVIVTRLWRQSHRVLRQRMPAFIGVTSLALVIIGATLMFVAEQGSGGPINTFADAVWWALTTITTVGYGDTYPVTALGRGVAVFLMIAGISLFGLLTANVAAFFVEEDTTDRTQAELVQLNQRIERMERQLAALAQRLEEGQSKSREQ
ncbi:ion channel [Chloroflexus sp.]|uniref:ion channel n=1 Tax=Chloroflexus sp. TaxID=1904827 RepID=UPI002ACEFBCC|nr:ion channel [Chloroflexus sp.]